jgi:hypothetical protein
MVHRSRKVLFSLRRRSVRDAVTIAGLCLVTYVAAATFDIFGQTYEFIKRYEAYELDEAIVVAIVLGSGLIDYNQKMTMAAMQIADMNV